MAMNLFAGTLNQALTPQFQQDIQEQRLEKRKEGDLARQVRQIKKMNELQLKLDAARDQMAFETQLDRYAQGTKMLQGNMTPAGFARALPFLGPYAQGAGRMYGIEAPLTSREQQEWQWKSDEQKRQLAEHNQRMAYYLSQIEANKALIKDRADQKQYLALQALQKIRGDYAPYTYFDHATLQYAETPGDPEKLIATDQAIMNIMSDIFGVKMEAPGPAPGSGGVTVLPSAVLGETTQVDRIAEQAKPKLDEPFGVRVGKGPGRAILDLFGKGEDWRKRAAFKDQEPGETPKATLSDYYKASDMKTLPGSTEAYRERVRRARLARTFKDDPDFQERLEFLMRDRKLPKQQAIDLLIRAIMEQEQNAQ